MPRQVRIEFPGAVYHAMARGDRREDIVRDDGDRERRADPERLETAADVVKEDTLGEFDELAEQHGRAARAEQPDPFQILIARS